MIEWITSSGLVEYSEALQIMQERVKAIQKGTQPELVWLLEHPSLYTAGTSTNEQEEVINIDSIPFYKTDRGGKITYHGPGQRIAYVLLDLNKRNPDIRNYIKTLEEWLIKTLAEIGVTAQRREGRIGLWVQDALTEKKIAAIGVRVQKWITFHGIALNVNPDLSYFQKILPCGIKDYGVTSLKELGINISFHEVDHILTQKFKAVFEK